MTERSPLDIASLWRIALGEIELSVSKANFTTWFKNVTLQGRHQDSVVIVTPNIFTREWLENKYHSVILEALQRIDPSIQNVRYVISTQPIMKIQPVPHSPVVIRKHQDSLVVSGASSPEAPEEKRSVWWDEDSNLNARYTFEEFVVGANNELVYAAAQAVARRPGESYNPLFIYGGVGLGKTHILQAIGNAVLAEKQLRVKYVTSEKFTTELITAIQTRDTHTFKKRYRLVDLLIIDDVQFIIGKEKTQDEFFHTFNELHSGGKQVVISSDRPPKAIPTLEERLRSRFEGGMIADITPPDLETRIAILQVKCARRRVRVPDDVLAYLAAQVPSNIRELEGCLNRVLAHCELHKEVPTLSRTQEILQPLLTQPKRRIIHTNRIIEAVSTYYNISTDELLGESRRREVVRPRQVAMYLLRSENQFSFPTIGKYFGGRDHTTAMHSCGKIEENLETDEMLRQDLVTIRQKLYVLVGV